MATTKATTSDADSGSNASAGSGDELISEDDRRTAGLSVDDRKTSSTTLKSGTKVTGPTEVINKLKGT